MPFKYSKSIKQILEKSNVEVLDYTKTSEKLDENFFKKLKELIEKKLNLGKIIIIKFLKRDSFKIPFWFIEWIKKLRKRSIFIIIILVSLPKNNCCISSNLFTEIDNDFKDYLFNNTNYDSKLNNLKTTFSTAFMNTSPTYFTGNVCDKERNNDKYVLISLNPGAQYPNPLIEDLIMNISYYLTGIYNYQDWLNFYISFYEIFFINGLTSKYYTRLINLFAGLHRLPQTYFSGKGIHKQRQIYNFYDSYLINIDLIPYRSHSTSTFKTTSHGICYLNKRFYEILNQISCIKSKFNLRKVILNGKVFVDLIVNQQINNCCCKNCQTFSLNTNTIRRQPYKNFTIYDININGIDVVVIDRFLTYVGKGSLTNNDLYNLGTIL